MPLDGSFLGASFTQLVRQIPCVLIDDRFMGVRENQKFVRSCLLAFFGLEVLADGLAEDGMAQILLTVQDIGNRCIRPEIGIMIIVISGCHAFLLPVRRRNQNIICLKCFRDCPESHSFGGHREDPLPYFSGLRIDIQCLFVIQLPCVAIGNSTGATQALFHVVAEDGLDLLAGVLRVPLVHDIQEGCELILCRIIAVDIVIDRDEPDPFVREQDLRVITDLKIVPAKTAHVLHAYYGYISRLDLFEKGSESGSVEIGSGITVIGEMPDIRQSFGPSIIFRMLLDSP